MSVYGDITNSIREIIVSNNHVDTLSPTLVALQTLEKYGKPSEIHIEYLSFEQAKQMARAELRAKFDPEGADNDAHQSDMFSGILQQRYPVQTRRGEDPKYKFLRLLTVDELDWNINQLLRSADARIQHAHALQAHRDSMARAAA
jgi:hypothetical protein